MASSTLLLVALYFLVQHPCIQCDAVYEDDIEGLDDANLWIISNSTPCSTTCGVGLQTQELCPLEPSTDKDTGCHLRQVQCVTNWYCGIKTQMVAIGKRVELDCLNEVLAALGYFTYRVSWRFARGIITSDSRLFVRLDSARADGVVLDPVREQDAGTYLCDVQDATHHMVKRMFHGVKVYSPQVMNLDFSEGLRHWENPWSPATDTEGSMILIVVLTSVATSIGLFLVLVFICCVICIKRRRQRRQRGQRQPTTQRVEENVEMAQL